MYYTNFIAFIGCCFAVLFFIFSNHFGTFSKCYPSQKEEVTLKSRNTTLEGHFASSVWCMNRLDGTKFCTFKNLYHLPEYKDHLLFILNEFSVVTGIESSSTLKSLTLSTVLNHSGVILKLVIIKSFSYIEKHNIIFLENNHILIKRFKPDNILHVIHDDLIPLFFTYDEMCKGEVELCTSTNQLVFADDNDKGPYFEWYRHFSFNDPMSLVQVNIPICFKSVVIGMSRRSVWFQYGFKTTQGPVINSSFNGLELKRFSDFIKIKLKIKTRVEKHTTKHLPPIIFFSRKINRKILNEKIVENLIQERYQHVKNSSVDIVNMDISTHDANTLISVLQKSNILIGMHGSAMILGMFLPQASTIIELFPYGIQPHAVSPLRALCLLPYVSYTYKAWVNGNESNSVPHPEYPPLLGGLHHLTPEEQDEVMIIKSVPAVECCHHTAYLYRMYQDTVVDDSFFILFKNVLAKSLLNGNTDKDEMGQSKYNSEQWYFPPPVLNLSCVCKDKKLHILWSFPFNSLSEVVFSIAASIGVAVMTKSTFITIGLGECKRTTPVSVWVKTIEGNKESIDSYVQCV